MKNNASNLPEGFVYIEEIDPSIRHHLIMYYEERNFIGRRINGYKAPKVILTYEAAMALKQVQEDIRKDNYSLVIYDTYRPCKAVQHFIAWGEDVNDQKMKEAYYPYITKEEIFEGYLSKRSAHSRGSTVDLTLIELGKELNTAPPMIKRSLKDGRFVPYFDDNTVDMYSSIDLMDKASHHDCDLIDERCLQNRNYLRSKMKKYNFKEFSMEWWHYTLENEPFPNEYFDFDVE